MTKFSKFLTIPIAIGVVSVSLSWAQPKTPQRTIPTHIRFYLGKSIGGGLSVIEGPMIWTRTNPYVGKPEITVQEITTIGTGYTFNADLLDEMDQKIDIEVHWKSSNPKIISITPMVGNQVTAKGVNEGIADIIIRAGGLEKILKGIRVKKDDDFKQ